MPSDYLILGSGLAGLSVGALLARSGAPVRVLEAHYHPGGYGHTFVEGSYRFNAQLHYVWNCGEGRTVDNFLRKLGLDQDVTFGEYDRQGFDRMRMPGYALDIPCDLGLLGDRLEGLLPADGAAMRGFLSEVELVEEGLDHLASLRRPLEAVQHLAALRRLVRYRKATLQNVFDAFQLPLPAQTLLALQWPDFLLPPGQLSFFAWVMLFTGYCRGAYYPTKHFEHVIDSLVGVIEKGGGEVLLRHRVREFIVEGKRVVGVVAEEVEENGDATGRIHEFRSGEVICNMDPRRAAEMIGLEHFSPKLRRKLDYEYSPSNFMAYCVVEGIDLRDYGFGRSNLFHSEMEDLNEAFHAMYHRGDYSRPSFAVTVPSLLTNEGGDCDEGKQIIEFLTVANYERFLQLKLSDPRAYRARKQEILDSILDVMERHYVPGIRDHICFKMTGSPTTNERYCASPAGHSYGSNMTPENIGFGRLDHRSSLEHFHFCSASAGFAGFAGTIWTGCQLYEHLTGDRVHEGPHLLRAS
ncbi:MAG: NAD(P)/FAD-dependent oxidoreductase [Deltaproteobacteria bacterium]|nr:NAD(P)/FAD-dependent oxidoreductase [Deltaproteobacteria bacterium]